MIAIFGSSGCGPFTICKLSRFSFKQSIPLLVVVLGLSLPLAASTDAPTKDPAALAVLARMATATGWNVNPAPADAVVTGTVDRVRANEHLNFTYKVRGRTQLHSELQGTVSTTFVINNGTGAISRSDGFSRFVDPQEASLIWPVLLPLFSVWPGASTNPIMSLSYLGEEPVNSVSCSKILISIQVDPGDPLRAVKELTGSVVLWVDATTGLPTQVQYARTASDNPTATLVFLRQLSNFQKVNGLLIPFTQQEFVGATLIASEQVTNVTFNVGLTDADFTLPAVQ